MRRLSKLFMGAALLAMMVALPLTTASAASATQHYGPYASNSPDSGTCGNDWANDTFDRDYTVRKGSGGTFEVTEQFKNGSFVTNAGASPGGCDTNPGGTLTAGITGKMQGSFLVVVTGGTYNPNATCTAACYTADFVSAFFGPTATYDVPTYLLHYTAKNHGEWKNASADRGGNQGDITG
jgi:hypothetical protein